MAKKAMIDNIAAEAECLESEMDDSIE